MMWNWRGPSIRRMPKRQIVLISTGGTMEKTYDEISGALHNEVSVLDVMLDSLQLEGISVVRIPLLNKDSLHFTEEDHKLIAQTAMSMTASHDGVVIVHGTDTLARTGEMLHGAAAELSVPVVLTGAMRPYIMRNTDALQNLTEALLAVQWLGRGVYLAMHNRLLTFPGVVKDTGRGTFVSEKI